MLKKWCFVLLVSFCFFESGAQSGYPVFLLKDTLLKNANAVVRQDESVFEIISPSKAILTKTYAITILNEKGQHWSTFVSGYDKHRKILDAEGSLYDATGTRLKRVKLKEMADVSAVSDINLADDNRLKQHNFMHRNFPYTVEYTVKTEFNSTLFFPPFVPQPGSLISTEKSSFTIISPADYKIRYKAFNISENPEIKTENGKAIHRWALNDIPAFKREPYAPPIFETAPLILFAPSAFSIDDYSGNMNTWQDFGKFLNTLKENRDSLPDNVKQKVHEIAKQYSDPKEQVQALYKYMQNNTRYISIQLGIGGWQPFHAAEVASKAYGDCKALTNYMYALLKEVNIPSYYAVIKAGKNEQPIFKDFPSQQFNHVILCVPLQNDTIWLECTSQTLPAGYLSGFTSDRYALLVNQDGGKLVRTPAYTLKDNVQQRNIQAVADAEGNLILNTYTAYKGSQQDDLHQIINALTKDELKRFLKNDVELATYEIDAYDYQEVHNKIPEIHEKLKISVSNYATVSGKRFFIQPNILTRSNFKPSEQKDRKKALQLYDAYVETDSVKIEIPDGYTAETLPHDEDFSSPFGTYHSSVKVEGSTILYYRRFEKFEGRFDVSTYDEFVQFFQNIYKADRKKVVLVKENP
jgi:hypothetical protein